jgi:uncharacterized protein YndB with AHSA1/START domain
MSHLTNLNVTTPSEREIMMTRMFEASRSDLFAALTQPELLKQWFSTPPRWELAESTMDLREGGSYRHVWRSPEGGMIGMGGTFLEVVVPERIVQTEVFDNPWFEGDATGMVFFVEHEGHTTLIQTVQYISQDVRNAVLASPMVDGVEAAYDRLAALLAH